jgi:hypothetical protein
MSAVDHRIKKSIIRPETWQEFPVYRKILGGASIVSGASTIVLGILFIARLGSRVPDAVHTHVYHGSRMTVYQTNEQVEFHQWAFYLLLVVASLSLICAVIEDGLKRASFKKREAAFFKRLSDETE